MNDGRPHLAGLVARGDQIARLMAVRDGLERQLSTVTLQRDMARAELAELREHIRQRDERRRAAVDALCEALGLPPH